MFRIPGKILMRSLTRQQPVGTQLARLSRLKYSPQERNPCPQPPPPPPPKPKDDSAFWGALTVMFIAAGFAVLAKSSPEIRDWLTIYLPWFDDAIAILYEENLSYSEFAAQCIDDIKKYIAEFRSDSKPKQCSTDGKPIITVPEKKDVVKKSEKNPDCDIIPPPVVTKGIGEIEKCIIDLSDTVLNNYYTATEACAYYNREVEETMKNFSIPAIKKLQACVDERKELIVVSLKNATEASAELEELNHYFECGVTAPKEAIQKTRALISDYNTKIKTSITKFELENNMALKMDANWQIVEQSIDEYVDTVQTVSPEINYIDNKLQITESDPDLLLYHTYRYAQKLKSDLNIAVANMTDRVDRGMETLAPDKTRDSKIQNIHYQKKSAIDKEIKQRYNEQNARNDKIAKEAMKMQLVRLQEELEKKLIEKEAEANVKLKKMVDEKVASEKKIFAHQLADMAAKLKVVEDRINAHILVEKETKRSQELWIAGSALLAATKKGEKCVNVQKELNAIEKANDNDKLVQTVMKAIPASVKQEGLIPESILRERYHRMEDVALKVALVEQDGSPLPVYILSWLQHAFLFMKLAGIPREEIEKPPKEPFENLDTFDKLQRARFWMDKGNLAAAIRYVSSLQGASRLVAATWTDAAKAHLETRQAAEAILAHAAAIGLKYI